MTEEVTNDLVKYGVKLEELGRKFQDGETTLQDLVVSASEVGLIVTFAVEPDPEGSIELAFE